MGDKPKKPRVKPPMKCVGCVWGRWEAPTQFCSKPLGCVKQQDGGGQKA